METMDDYKEELEASFRRIREGDIISGTVIDVNEEQVTLDLRYYAPGIIKTEDISSDPDFAVLEQVHVGDVIEASVIRTDDGAGNILLSKKEANDELAWEKLQRMLEEEFENMGFVKINLVRKFHGSGKFLLRLPGKSYDYVRGQRGILEILPQKAAFFIIFLRGIPPVHPFQRSIAAALQRQMEMRAQLLKPRRRPDKFLRDNAGFQRSQDRKSVV